MVQECWRCIELHSLGQCFYTSNVEIELASDQSILEMPR